ncbi:hypothetical protein J7E88_12295 [Streptomyces sp. ISL-10]|uniref:baeRF2 domain-containing protein n=1 Tax=Streptomyces sp. ISL-10 TaxID=2819172 RepID=UPI001BEBA01F|nr:Vms1/Ankzf1 family peptidyl-tRNA hydrolase [Streptomyces sp. ISL-10]MBT2366066.1 hypothetical protein [Streptomyces sp. ISL-10]
MEPAFLTPLYERPGPWASVQVDTGWTDESAAARRELQARDICDELAALGCDEATGAAVYEALTARPDGAEDAGRAVYAAGGEVVLDQPLSARPPAPMDVTWSALPRVAPLLDLAAQDPVCVVACIDRLGADLEVRTPLGGRDAGTVGGREYPVHLTGRADRSARHFRQSVENTWEHNAAETAAAVAQCQADTHADLIVLAGDPRERAAVHRRLPEALQDLVVETEHGGRAGGASTRLLDEDVDRARREHVRRRADHELERFRSAHEATAEGVPALVEAARQHRIAELLVRPDGPDNGREVWIGAEPDQLSVHRSDARYLGETRPEPARADDALLRSAAVTGARGECVHPAAGDDIPAGGLGALLRGPYGDGERT